MLRRGEESIGRKLLNSMQRTTRPRCLLPATIRLFPTSRHLRIFLCLLLACAPVLTGCLTPRGKPNLERIFAEARTRTGKRPLIVIPGVLGSQLENYETGEIVWPSAFRSSDDGLSLPVSPDL